MGSMKEEKVENLFKLYMLQDKLKNFPSLIWSCSLVWKLSATKYFQLKKLSTVRCPVYFYFPNLGCFWRKKKQYKCSKEKKVNSPNFLQETVGEKGKRIACFWIKTYCSRILIVSNFPGYIFSLLFKNKLKENGRTAEQFEKK